LGREPSLLTLYIFYFLSSFVFSLFAFPKKEKGKKFSIFIGLSFLLL